MFIFSVHGFQIYTYVMDWNLVHINTQANAS